MKEEIRELQKKAIEIKNEIISLESNICAMLGERDKIANLKNDLRIVSDKIQNIHDSLPLERLEERQKLFKFWEDIGIKNKPLRVYT